MVNLRDHPTPRNRGHRSNDRDQRQNICNPEAEVCFLVALMNKK